MDGLALRIPETEVIPMDKLQDIAKAAMERRKDFCAKL